MKVTHVLYDSVPNREKPTSPLDVFTPLSSGVAVWEEETTIGKVRRARRFASVACEPKPAWPYYISDVDCTFVWEDGECNSFLCDYASPDPAELERIRIKAIAATAALEAQREALIRLANVSLEESEG